jgi:hypothetical protein
LNALNHDDIAHEVGVRLLPERFLSFTPDGGDDRGDIEGLDTGVKIVARLART